MTDTVLLEVTEGVADVRLNRPEAYNSLNGAMIDALLAVVETIRSRTDIQVVVLSGQGKGFCSGLDMSNFGDMVSGDLTADTAASAYDELSEAGANRVQQLGWQWQELDLPVIAAIHGAAMGGGLNLALGADIRIAAPDAKFGFVEISWGLLPDMSATQSLRRLMPLDRVKELVLSGRRLNGEEALAYGLVTRLSPTPLEAALELGRLMATRNPDALRRGKRLLNNSALVSVRQGLLEESTASRELLGTANQLEAVMSTLEKRAPKYRYE
jgi:enoyl-CoA hydratase/carnithine racemase